MAIQTLDLRRPSAAGRIAGAVERDGAVVLDHLFPKRLLEALRRDVLRRHESGQLRRGLVRDIGGRCTCVLPFAGPYLDPRLYAHPAVLKALAALLGAEARLSSLEVVVSLPGSSRQYQHIDGPLRLDGRARGAPPRLPPYALALATPLCGVDEENGPTALWPGSHREGLRRPLPSQREIRRKYPEVRMTGPFGRSYLYDYRTFHLGLPNYSRQVRPLLMLVYSRDWYRDPNLADVDSGLSITARALAAVPARHRRLFALAPAARRALWR